ALLKSSTHRKLKGQRFAWPFMRRKFFNRPSLEWPTKAELGPYFGSFPRTSPHPLLDSRTGPIPGGRNKRMVEEGWHFGTPGHWEEGCPIPVDFWRSGLLPDPHR